jgi:hypothetical protein
MTENDTTTRHYSAATAAMISFWTAGERLYYQQNSLQQPKRCKACRQARRSDATWKPPIVTLRDDLRRASMGESVRREVAWRLRVRTTRVAARRRSERVWENHVAVAFDDRLRLTARDAEGIRLA